MVPVGLQEPVQFPAVFEGPGAGIPVKVDDDRLFTRTQRFVPKGVSGLLGVCLLNQVFGDEVPERRYIQNYVGRIA